MTTWSNRTSHLKFVRIQNRWLNLAHIESVDKISGINEKDVCAVRMISGNEFEFYLSPDDFIQELSNRVHGVQ